MELSTVLANARKVAISDEVAPDRGAIAFHRRLPGYEPTPLRNMPTLAEVLGVGQVWVKDESSRLGLPAFKILGASWAVYSALDRYIRERGGAIAPWASLDELREQLAPLRPMLLAAATDGNHGRAVARMARLLGFDAQIVVPAGTAQARIDALHGEGADVTIVDGSYDDAVAASAKLAGPRCLVISDTAWEGYVDVPREVIAGYATIFWEIDDALGQIGVPQPDVVLVQVGVGALAAAVVRHYRRQELASQPAIVGVEPTRAACVLASVEAGQIVSLPGSQDSIMAGLNCGTPSPIAWPLISTGIDLFLAVDDERAREAMRLLAGAGVVAGETGAAGMAGLLELMQPEHAAARSSIGLDRTSRVLLLITEGATDPEAYERITRRAH